jgi:hypothetical protein
MTLQAAMCVPGKAETLAFYWAVVVAASLAAASLVSLERCMIVSISQTELDYSSAVARGGGLGGL